MSQTETHSGGRRGAEPDLTADQIAMLAAQLSPALHEEPFELIGYAAIAASALNDDLGDHLRRLAGHDPRLQPVLATIVAAMPMVADLAPEPADCPQVPALPPWLERLDDACLTAASRRWESEELGRSSHLLEISLPTVQPVTAIVRIGECSGGSVVTDLHTTTQSLSNAADDQLRKFGWANPRPYEPVAVDEAVDTIRRALVRWLIHDCDRCDAERPFPGWPNTAPELAWIVGLPPARAGDEAA